MPKALRGALALGGPGSGGCGRAWLIGRRPALGEEVEPVAQRRGREFDARQPCREAVQVAPDGGRGELAQGDALARAPGAERRNGAAVGPSRVRVCEHRTPVVVEGNALDELRGEG